MWNPFRKKILGYEEEGMGERVQGEEEGVDNFAIIENANEGVGWQAEGQTGEQISEQVFDNNTPNELGETDGFLAVEEPAIPEKREVILIETKTTRILTKTIRGLMVALLILVPIFFLPFTAPGDVLGVNKQILIYSVCFVALILWFSIIVIQNGLAIRRSGFEWGILAWLGAALAAAILSVQPYRSFLTDKGFVILATLVLFYILFLNFFQRSDLKRIINYLILGFFFAQLVGLLTLFKVQTFKWITTFFYKDLVISSQFNTVGSFTILGALSVLTLIMMMTPKAKTIGEQLQLDETGDKSFSKDSTLNMYKWFWLSVRTIASIVSVWLLLVINWWVLYLVMIIGVLAIMFTPSLLQWASGNDLNGKNRKIILPLVALTLALLLIVGSRYVNLTFPGRKNLPVEVSLSQQGSWGIIEKIVKEKPVFGYGQDNFYLAFDKYKPEGINQSFFWNTRFMNAGSEALNVIGMTGLVTLAAFGVLLYFVFNKIIWSERKFRYLQAEAGMDDSKQDKIAALQLILPLFITMLGVFFLYSFDLTLLFTFWVILSALAVAAYRDGGEFKAEVSGVSLSSILPSLVFVLVLAASIIGGYLVVQRYRSELAFAQINRMTLRDSADVDRAIDKITFSVNNNLGDVKYVNTLAQLVYGRLSLETNNKTDSPQVVSDKLKNLTESLIQIIARMTTQFKHDSASWLNAGVMYQNLSSLVNGADQVAISSLQEYIKRAPGDPNGYVRQGSLYLDRAERNNTALSQAKSRKVAVQNEKEVIDIIIDGYKQAEINFTKSLSMRNDLAQALYNLGIVYERQNRLPDAVKALELTQAREPNNPGLAFELGLLYYRNNQKQQSINQMARAIAIFKDYSNARWYLALMLEEQGRVDLALGQLGEIIKLDVNKDNQVVLNKIASLEAGQREFPPAKVTGRQPLEQQPPKQK